LLRQILVIVVQVYLTVDYCDPLVPGVFSFETDSFFVDSIEARPAMPALSRRRLKGRPQTTESRVAR